MHHLIGMNWEFISLVTVYLLDKYIQHGPIIYNNARYDIMLSRVYWSCLESNILTVNSFVYDIIRYNNTAPAWCGAILIISDVIVYHVNYGILYCTIISMNFSEYDG